MGGGVQPGGALTETEKDKPKRPRTSGDAAQVPVSSAPAWENQWQGANSWPESQASDPPSVRVGASRKAVRTTVSVDSLGRPTPAVTEVARGRAETRVFRAGLGGRARFGRRGLWRTGCRRRWRRRSASAAAASSQGPRQSKWSRKISRPSRRIEEVLTHKRETETAPTPGRARNARPARRRPRAGRRPRPDRSRRADSSGTPRTEWPAPAAPPASAPSDLHPPLLGAEAARRPGGSVSPTARPRRPATPGAGLQLDQLAVAVHQPGGRVEQVEQPRLVRPKVERRQDAQRHLLVTGRQTRARSARRPAPAARRRSVRRRPPRGASAAGPAAITKSDARDANCRRTHCRSSSTPSPCAG